MEKYSEETLNDLNKVKIHLEYAGESGMRHHSDLMALYEIYKTTPLENAWKTAYLEQNTTPEMEESEVEINKNSMIVPRPVEVLAATDNLESFLSSLRSYTKADKIMLYGNQTEIPANEKLIFVAIVPGEELVGIYYKSDDGFVNIKTDEIITTFEGKYTGARQIWMVINE